jgi:flagellar biosynthesis protein FlhG
MRVIPIASGKGGVGKSLLAANLAIALGQSGADVVLADLDLGASNLHLILARRRSGRGSAPS